MSSRYANFERPLTAASGRVWQPWWLAGNVRPQDCVAAYQPMGAHSLTESYTNLAQRRFNAYPGTAPTWDTVSGWKFAAASSQYLVTGIIVSSNTWSILIKYSNAAALDGGYLSGAYSPSARDLQIIPRHWSGVFYGNGGNGYVFVAPGLTSGVLGIAGKSAYRNGIADGTIAAGTTMSGINLYIGAMNSSGDPTGYFTTANIQTVGIYSTTLTARQMSAITYAMNHCTEPMYNGWMKPTEMLGWKAAVGGGLSIPVAMATYRQRRNIDNG